MEKQQPKLKNRILKMLPRAAAAVTVTFQNPPFSPGRDHKRTDNTTRWFKNPGGRGFSGPLIPAEARRKPKDGGIDSQEPTSPKVSCMGQIKHKKKQIKKVKSMPLPKYNKPVIDSPRSSIPKEVRKHKSTFKKIFHHGAKPAGRKSDASDGEKVMVPDRAAPAANLSQMKRFASGRDTFANFDWKAQVAPAEEIDHHEYHSDEDRVESGGEEELEVIIPFSAPILVGGGGRGVDVPLQPRKEINLWKRRTMEPPRPLQLNTVKRTS